MSFSFDRRCVPLLLVVTLVLFLGTACHTGDCTKRPDPREREEEIAEYIDDFLDEGDATDAQRRKVQAKNKGLAAQRTKLRNGVEEIRTKMLAELVKAEPDAKKLHGWVDELSGMFRGYAKLAIQRVIDSHSMFSREQRTEMIEPFDEPLDPYDGSWLMNRALDVALIKMDATDAQKNAFWAKKDEMEAKYVALQKKQHAIRLELVRMWPKEKPDTDRVWKLVDRAGDQITLFFHGMVDDSLEAFAIFEFSQRKYLNEQIRRMRRCGPDD